MFYTLFFYIILAILGTQIHNRKKALKAIFTFAAIYMSLRYNYPSDYPAYQGVFEQYSSSNYIYDSNIDHMEYGWYLINRLFAPLGFYVFVAFCSCIFTYGLYLVTEAIVPQKYITLVSLGIFAMGNFEILMSAQRQLLVAGIFLIAYRKLIFNRLSCLKELFKFRTVLYFAIIIGCYYFHRSSLFLLLIPFLYLLPSKSLLVMIGLAIFAFFLLQYGDIYLVDIFEQLQEQTGEYDYMVFTGMYSGTISFLQAVMWAFQFYFVALVYMKYNYDSTEKAIMLISMLSILIIISGYSLGQIARLSHYIYIFTFMTIAILAQKLRITRFYQIFLAINWIWVIWNMLKVFSVSRGTLFEYKLLLFYI